jgi:hypothetical protein
MTEQTKAQAPIVKFSSRKRSKKEIRRLRRGRGKLLSVVDKALLGVKETAGDGNVIEVPIVVYFEEIQDSPLSSITNFSFSPFSFR